MEEATSIKTIQKSGSPFVYISKEAIKRLRLKPGDKLTEKIEPPNRLIYEVVKVVRSERIGEKPDLMHTDLRFQLSKGG